MVVLKRCNKLCSAIDPATVAVVVVAPFFLAVIQVATSTAQDCANRSAARSTRNQRAGYRANTNTGTHTAIGITHVGTTLARKACNHYCGQPQLFHRLNLHRYTFLHSFEYSEIE